ncbi:MAG TPA: UDP-glucuronic acid decarboxylase family protein [Actinomycetota bacterium]
MTRAVVTGGAGFLGSHLCRRLVAEGWYVICLDSLLTGSETNIADLLENHRFTFERTDIIKGIEVSGEVDWVFHLASPASPRDYAEHPIHTMKVGALGTLNCLGLAKARRAGFMLTSTSEVYGDPDIHPQPEIYWGNVNPIGPRGVYDEAKRFAEALTMSYRREHGISIRIARIFNTYGPGMRRGDGRAVPTFIEQALAGEPLTVHGDGRQTRSLCYVDDLIEGFWRLLRSVVQEPVNLGSDQEISIGQLAEAVIETAGSTSEIVFTERPVDDPEIRRPDLTRAREWLGWEPQVSLSDGLKRTVEWARETWALG